MLLSIKLRFQRYQIQLGSNFFPVQPCNDYTTLTYPGKHLLAHTSIATISIWKKTSHPGKHLLAHTSIATISIWKKNSHPGKHLLAHISIATISIWKKTFFLLNKLFLFSAFYVIFNHRAEDKMCSIIILKTPKLLMIFVEFKMLIF